MEQPLPAFIRARTGDVVAVEENANRNKGKSDWWIGLIICSIGTGKDPSNNSIFQIANIDTGCIKTINANLVKEILKPKKQ